MRIINTIIMCLLLSCSSNLIATKVDKAIYLPDKLCYTSLPDDYPPELDELFYFFYETFNLKPVQMIERGEAIPDNYLQNVVNDLNEAEIMRYIYLIWLANNSIPLYFEEYQEINYYVNLNNSDPELDKAKYTILPEITKDYGNNSLRILGLLIGKLKNAITVIFPDNILFGYYSSIDQIVIRGVVEESIYSEIIKRKNDYSSSHLPENYVTVRITDVIGDKFKDQTISLRILLDYINFDERNKEMNLDQCLDNAKERMLTIGSEYFIIFTPLYYWKYFDPNKEPLEIGGKAFIDKFCYSSNYRFVHEIKNEEVAINPPNVYFNDFFQSQSGYIPYEDIKQKICNDINVFKEYNK